MIHTPGSIIFDLDGTLLDTAPDLAAALNLVLKEEGCQSLPLSSVRSLVGRGAVHMIKEGLTQAGMRIDGALPEELRTRFLDHYRACCIQRTTPFPGVVEALTKLRQTGHPLAVCTNKSYAMSVAIIEGLKLNHFFSGIIGGDTLAHAKPNPAPIHAAIGLTGGSTETAIMVGDSITDVRAAFAAGIPVIAVTFGYTEIAPRDLGADAIIDHFDQLIPTIKKVAESRHRPGQA